MVELAMCQMLRRTLSDARYAKRCTINDGRLMKNGSIQ
jgi:hypothetical protein